MNAKIPATRVSSPAIPGGDYPRFRPEVVRLIRGIRAMKEKVRDIVQGAIG